MNWMRLNSPPIASARVLIAIVLARPGHALDEDVAAGEQRDDQPLQQVVLADDDLLDLVQQPLHRGGALSASSGWSTRISPQYGGRPAAPPATSIGTARPMPMKTSSSVGLTSAVTIPMTWPSRFEQRSAGVARVDGRVDLDQAVEDLVAVGQRERAVEAGDDADAHRAVEAERVAHA